MSHRGLGPGAKIFKSIPHGILKDTAKSILGRRDHVDYHPSPAIFYTIESACTKITKLADCDDTKKLKYLEVFCMHHLQTEGDYLKGEREALEKRIPDLFKKTEALSKEDLFCLQRIQSACRTAHYAHSTPESSDSSSDSRSDSSSDKEGEWVHILWDKHKEDSYVVESGGRLITVSQTREGHPVLSGFERILRYPPDYEP